MKAGSKKNTRMKRSFSRHQLYVGLFAALAALAADFPAQAQQARAESVAPQQYNIAAGELGDALNQLAAQSHLQIVYAPELVQGKTAPSINGQLTWREALGKLLAGSGLEWSTVGDNMVAIRKAPPPILKKGPAPTSPPPSTRPAEKATAVQPTTLQAVVVTGSRIPQAESQQAVPVHVYTSEDIERSGQITVSDFLNTLPQVSVPSRPGQQTFASYRGIQLHGLPLGTTLFLINGQRTEISNFGYFDTSMIPAAAVDRIEVIPVGSSAIYGSDAIAGVVNVILKKDFDGAEVNGTYGAARDTHNASANAAFGKSWERGSFSLVVNAQNQSGLSASDRKLSSMGNYTSLGGQNYDVDSCNPGNVYSLNGANLPGVNSTSAGIPSGIQGKPSTSAFAGTAGKINTCDPFATMSLIPSSKQTGLVLSGHYQAAPWIDLFADVFYSHYETDVLNVPLIMLGGGSAGLYRVSAANPYNPFGEDVGVSWSSGVTDYQRTVDFVRPVIGARGDLPGDWHWELSGMYAWDKMRISYPSQSDAAINDALASSDPATALNVFTSGSPGSTALVNSLYTLNYNRYEDSLLLGQFVVRGPLFTLPAGKVQAVFGATSDRLNEWDQLVVGNTPSPASNLSRDEYAVFTEERVPLIASSQQGDDDQPEVLALSVAGRYDHSSDFGGKATFQGGLEWRPVTSLLVRGALGTSYRAPQLSELYGADQVGYTTTIVDPYRGGQTYDVGWPQSSNPNLKPETGLSRSLGVVYSSESLPGFETSLTWWSIDYENYIGTPAVQDVIQYPDRYPAGLVQRSAPSAQDIASGWLGAITSVTSMPVNFGSLKVRGVDFDASYRIPSDFGTWKPAVSLTETYKYEVALSPSQPAFSAVSRAQLSPGVAPRWKGNVSLNWEKGALTAGITGRYTGSYHDYAGWAPEDYTIGNFWLFDANVRYDFGRHFAKESFWHGAYASVGGVNIFDRRVQFSYVPYGYDFAQADIRGRYLYVKVGVSL